jgi:hypothetical protein
VNTESLADEPTLTVSNMWVLVNPNSSMLRLRRRIGSVETVTWHWGEAEQSQSGCGIMCESVSMPQMGECRGAPVLPGSH